ncbi:MAG: hypothetical protein QOE66_573, partial [Chloroflexota bacterium]|nr:hypothetical protein [Chloroflexota bacterium]
SETFREWRDKFPEPKDEDGAEGRILDN